MSEVCCVVFTTSIDLLLNYFCILFHTVNNSVILSNYVLFHNIFCSYFLYALLIASSTFQPSNFTFRTSFLRQYSLILLLICDLSYSEETFVVYFGKIFFDVFFGQFFYCLCSCPEVWSVSYMFCFIDHTVQYVLIDFIHPCEFFYSSEIWGSTILHFLIPHVWYIHRKLWYVERYSLLSYVDHAVFKRVYNSSLAIERNIISFSSGCNIDNFGSYRINNNSTMQVW